MTLWDMSREEAQEAMVASGELVRGCQGCEEFFNSPEHPLSVFAPRHVAMAHCRSGRRNHCTCDGCF